MSRVLPGRRRLLAVLTILLTTMVGTGVAWAVRSPTESESGGLQAALLNDCGLHQANCVWHGGLVSSVDSEFAFASAAGDTGEYDGILYRNGPDSNDWVVIDVMQPLTACDQLQTLVPPQVLDDLGVKGVKSAATPVQCGTPAATPKVCTNVHTSTANLGVSVLHVTCAKARSLVKTALKHGSKASSGWNWNDPAACSSFIVAHKNRKVQFPLVELTKGQPVIFIDQVVSTTTTTVAGVSTSTGTACDDGTDSQ